MGGSCEREGLVEEGSRERDRLTEFSLTGECQINETHTLENKMGSDPRRHLLNSAVYTHTTYHTFI